MDKQIYLPYRIYENIIKCLNYRNLSLVSGDLTNLSNKKSSGVLSYDDFVPTIQYHEYIMIEAADKPEKVRHYRAKQIFAKNKIIKTIFILLDQNASQVTAAQHFSKLLNMVPHIKSEDRPYNMDIIVVSGETLGINIVNKFAEYNCQAGRDSGAIRISGFAYSYFSSERMRHKSIPSSRIITQEEEILLQKQLLADKRDFPKKRVIDPVSVWLGAEVGDIIEQLIPSEVSGIEKKYFMVRP